MAIQEYVIITAVKGAMPECSLERPFSLMAEGMMGLAVLTDSAGSVATLVKGHRVLLDRPRACGAARPGPEDVRGWAFSLKGADSTVYV